MAKESFYCKVSDTRPANTDVYTALDVMGATAAVIKFNSVGPAGGRVLVTGMTLRGDFNAVPSGMSTMRYHLFNAAPANIADNAAFNLVAADRAKYQGYVDVSTPLDLGDTIFGQTDGSPNHQVQLAIGCTDLWAFRQTVGGFTPGANSEVYTTEMHTISVL
jgi:hypothetical protein